VEQKTKIHAVDGKQEIIITREFELPVDLLFRAYAEAELIEQWMGTKVVKLDHQRHGSYQFETTDPHGNKHRFNGAIHDVIPNEKIIRTFEMEGAPLGVQLEILEFEKTSDDTSRLNMQVVYRSIEIRDMQLKMPFAQGINWAHNRIQEILAKLK
jgi:uncharacterized protein YndB with AHSA1/START domain